MFLMYYPSVNWEKELATYNKWPAYGQSKTANIYMANSITRHYSSQNLLGWSLNPGGIVTEWVDLRNNLYLKSQLTVCFRI